MVLWNPELGNTLRRTLKTVEYSLLCQRVQGESFPNKAPDVSERPRFIFPMTDFFVSCGQNIGVSASTLVLPMNIQD